MQPGVLPVGLPEELLLLALHDVKGAIIPAASHALPAALAGAVLLELALRGQVYQDDQGLLKAKPTPPSMESVLGEALNRIERSPRAHTPGEWVGQINKEMPNLRDRLLERLVTEGVLERREERILWIIPKQSYPLADHAAEQQAIDRIRTALLEDTEPDERTTALIGLVRACNLLDEVVPPADRAKARRRAAELTATDKTADLFGSGAQAALMTALLGATIAYVTVVERGGGDTWSDSVHVDDDGATSDTASDSSDSGDSGGGDSGD